MSLTEFYSHLAKFLTLKIFNLAGTEITISSIIVFLIIITIAIFFSKKFAAWFSDVLLQKVPMKEGTRYLFKRVSEYLLIVFGAIVAFNTIGIDLKGLAVVFGLLSVGIGFGLQNITSNFISGLILLFEQPIKVGDRVTVGETEGDVLEINMRSTTVRSVNNISFIVPNSEFISSQVINWSHDDPKVRIDVNIGVAYDSDLDTVINALQEIAAENHEVLVDPEPEVLFMEFGDSSWNLKLRVWIINPKRHFYVRSDLNCAIVRKFREKNIEIPFPQRDVHFRTPLSIPSKTN